MNVSSPCRRTIVKTDGQIERKLSRRRGAGLCGGVDRRKRAVWAWISPRRRGRRPATAAGAKSGDTEQGAEVQPTVRGLPVPAHAAGASYMSPRMKARMNELGLHAADLAGLAGSGAAGRVTIQDFEKFIANLEKQQIDQRLVACAWPWPTRCAAVGPGRWPRWRCPVTGAMLAHRKSQPAQDRPGALRVARPGHGPVRKQRPGRPADRQ